MIFEKNESGRTGLNVFVDSVLSASSLSDIAEVFKVAFGASILVERTDYKKGKTPYGLQVRGKKTREKLNEQAKDILKTGKKLEVLTEDEVAVLKQYSGKGGLTVNSQFEYYTPTLVAEGAWDLMRENGLVNGHGFDPCVGAGVFSGTKPEGMVMTGADIDPVGSKVAGILNPEDTIENKSFERLAVETEDNHFDFCVANVPFGDARGKSAHEDPDFKNNRWGKTGSIQKYFVYRTLDKIKHGGLACFILPTNVIDGKDKKWKQFRTDVSRKAEFLGAHKLPSKTFSAQGTDTVVDVAVFKKHPADLYDKIDQLSADVLAETNVYFQEFIDGLYWKGEGRKFIMGKFVPKDPAKFRDVDKVESDIDNETLKKNLARKFHSRIDWDALDVEEPEVRNYAEGDRRMIHGIEHEFTGGKWERIHKTSQVTAIEQDKYGAASIEELKSLLDSPADCLNLSSNQAFAIYKTWPDMLPSSMRDAVEFSMSQPKDEHRELAFRGTVIGGMIGRLGRDDVDPTERESVKDLITSEIDKYGHPKNSRIMLTGETSRAFGLFLNSVDTKGNFSDLIEGTMDKGGDLGFDPTNPQAIIEHLFIREGIHEIFLDDFLKIYSGSGKIESLGDFAAYDDIAITPDGLIMPANRYCAGDIYPKINRMTEAMAEESDPRVKEKYQKQIERIMKARKTTDAEDITFGFQHNWIPKKYIVEFLKQNGYPQLKYKVRTTEDRQDPVTGKIEERVVWVEDYDLPGGEITGLKQTLFERQFHKYLNGGKVGNVEEESKTQYFKDIQIKEESFNAWMLQHPDIDKVTERYNRKFNAFLPFEYEDTDLGLTEIADNITLKGYQNAGIRRLSEEGCGILGFDVGLGKTFSALALHKYNKEKGRTKKTCIVVPKSVLPNWYHEARTLYKNLDDALFIGIKPKKGKKDGAIEREPVVDENGNQKYGKDGNPLYQDVLINDNSKDAKYADLWKVPQSNVSLVVMTKETFGMIPMRKDTKQSYVDKMVEKSLISSKNGEKTVAQNSVGSSVKRSYNDDKARLREEEIYSDEGTSKNKSLPYFEDMGFGDVIVDEFHEFKNSYEPGEQTKGIAYLPTAPSSQRAVDMNLKLNFIRSQNNGRGAYGLTATPVTNSPFEIYNMLSHVMPPEEFERMDINKVDDFVRVFGKVEMVDKIKVSGEIKKTEGLVGFQNLDGLRDLFHKYCNVKNADDVKEEMDLPPHEEVNDVVELSESQSDLYEELRERAKEAAKPKFMGGSGESLFSVIRDMDRVTTDMDLYHRTMTFHLRAQDQASADKLIADMPAKIDGKRYDQELGKMVKVRIDWAYTADLAGDVYVVVIPEDFEDVFTMRFPKFGIEEKNVGHPIMPKYAKLVENVRRDLDAGGKQLIFTEEKTQHQKIKRILVHALGIDENLIGIINADTADGEKLQRISDAYNSGSHKIVIANKKAEVGVNLQKGTTAIHHLTLPWTPASITQRNGRGIRQGNTASNINVYYYLGKGSFDIYRLDLIKSKSGWIGDLLERNGATTMENGDAFNGDDYLDMLESDPEAAKAKRLERLAAKKAEEAAKEAQRMATKLLQLGNARRDLDGLDGKKEAERASLTEKIEKLTAEIERAQERGKEMEDGSDEKKKLGGTIVNKKKTLSNAKRKLTNLDKTYEDTKKALESKISQETMLLKGKAKKGELPFDESLIDQATKVLVTLDGTVLKEGDMYEFTDDHPQFGSKGAIFKIMSVSSEFRLLKPESMIGRINFWDYSHSIGGHEHSGWFQAANWPKNLVKKVSYSEKEIEIMALLDRNASYGDLVGGAIDKEIYHEYADRIKFTSGLYVARSESGEIEFRMCQYGDRPVDLVFPDVENKDFKKAVCELYLKVKREKSYHREESRLMLDIFGHGYDAIAAEYGKKATEAEIRTAYMDRWNGIKESNVDDMSDPGEILNAFNAFRYDILQVCLKLGDNDDEIRTIVSGIDDGIIEDLHAKKRQKKEEEERKALEAVKNHPDYKEVPENIKKAFADLGIEIKTNTSTVISKGRGRYRDVEFKPFSKWFLDDSNGKNGKVYYVKDILKARYGALFCGNGGPGFSGVWHVPSSTDLNELYEVVA